MSIYIAQLSQKSLMRLVFVLCWALLPSSKNLDVAVYIGCLADFCSRKTD